MADQQSKPKASISILPLELLEQILLNIPPNSLLTTHREVCKSWKSIIETSVLVKHHITAAGLPRFPSNHISKPPPQKPEIFHPLFLKILPGLWKRLVPLTVKYQEPVGSHVSDQDREDISAALAREIETLYSRYAYIFSTVPFITPNWEYLRSRIETRNWKRVGYRWNILSKLDEEGEEQGEEHNLDNIKNGAEEQGAEKSTVNSSYSISFLKRKTDRIPLLSRNMGMLIYLCRFAFTHTPYQTGYENVKVEHIQSSLRIRIFCILITTSPEIKAGVRIEGVQQLTLPNFGDCKPEVSYI